MIGLSVIYLIPILFFFFFVPRFSFRSSADRLGLSSFDIFDIYNFLYLSTKSTLVIYII